MSDFLDHLAARAIGSETALAPRLPSLFEPSSRAPIMPPGDAGEVPARVRETSPAAAPTVDVTPSRRAPTPARESVELRVARVASVQPPTLATPARTTTAASHEPLPSPPRVAAPTRVSVADHANVPSTPDRSTASPTRASPPPSRITSTPREAVSAPAAKGALLPAPAPVFATTRATPAHEERTIATRAATARAEGQAATTAEPVVHVSIGRLEVRAAPVAAAPPRRREGPQPASLDDYLRQRGGKAAP